VNRNRILNRALQPPWLDAAFAMAQHPSGEDPRRLLNITLTDTDLAAGARAKIVEVLDPVWLHPPAETAKFIRWATDNVDPTADLRAVHLLALMATYPFFGDVCAAAGRLLRLDGEATTHDLRARLRAKWGDREVVNVAQRKCVQTLRAFSALSAQPRSSVSHAADPLPLPAGCNAWAIHALILSRHAESIDLMQVDVAPEIFFTRVDGQRSNAYSLLERFTMAAGRGELVLAR
jgi:hypothetical protein